jgi:multiple sugar transport system ATP-binding protein
VSRVRYEAVAKQFDDVVALESFDLEVPDGCFLVLLGPSGCGKTTALRILAGLEQPSEGRVFLGDRDVTALQPRDRDVAMVFQSYALYPHMSVEDNIGYPLKVRALGKPVRAAEVRKAAQLLEIDHLLGRRPRQLSGGQRQRVALARAIVRQPAVFLMDEPLSNLDAKLRASMRGELKRLQKRLETTTLYVTHDQAEATTMADLVAVLRDGRLQQLGTPDEIYDRPANRFVATFVGNPPMNVFPVAEAGMAPRGPRAGGPGRGRHLARRGVCGRADWQRDPGRDPDRRVGRHRAGGARMESPDRDAGRRTGRSAYSLLLRRPGGHPGTPD